MKCTLQGNGVMFVVSNSSTL